MKIQNDGTRTIPFNITDRSVEVKTTSLGAAPDTLPAMSTMTFPLQEGEKLVFDQNGGFTIKKDED